MSTARRVVWTVFWALLAFARGSSAPADAAQYVHQRTIPSPAPTSTGRFGSALAAVGPDVLVGHPAADVMTHSHAGAAHLFDGTTGALLRSFVSPTPHPTAYFGSVVAAIGPYVWVGSPTPSDPSLHPEQYLFDPMDGSVVATIVDRTRPTMRESFGSAVADLGGGLALVGEAGDGRTAPGSGAAYVIDTLGSPGGALLLDIVNPEPANHGFFGYAAATVGSDLLVGAYGNGGPGMPGAAYLLSGTTGAVLHKFVSPGSDTYFGDAVASDGTNILIGAPGIGGGGNAYLFHPDGTLVHTFANPTPQANEFFGGAVALTASTAIVAAPDESTQAGASGAVYVFDLASGNLLQTIYNPTPSGADFFGQSLALVGKNLYVGAPGDDAGAEGAGAVQMYALCGDNVVDPGEECDDGNLVPDDGCDPNCHPTGCGNGYVGAGEECDDGNTVGGDCCAADCTFESAGNTCPATPPYPGSCDGSGQCVAIPTLSEWGVIIMSALMLALVLWRRRPAPAPR